jgi:6,7-dimethyl-8-ribityllumazine synthase
VREIQGELDGRGLTVCLVAARFNETVVQKLVEGASRALTQHGVSSDAVELIWVPGAFELPAVAEARIQQGPLDALVALGAVIRGETPHFEYVAEAAAAGMASLGVRHRLGIGFGVLTVNTVEQATERAGGKLGNKGWEAACTALEMASVLRLLRAADR